MEQRAFQKEGTEFLRTTERAILGDDPGAGKTNQLILAAEGRTLILCPAMLQQVWEDEIERWHPDLNYRIVAYSSLCRRAIDARGYYSRVMPIPRVEYDVQWDTVIADECHYLKSRTANWTRAMKHLVKKADRVYLATGTPAPNWAHEIYMLLLLTHHDDPRFTNYRRWLIKWFDTWNPPWGGTKVSGLKKGITWPDFAIGNELDKCFLRRTREQVMSDLPPLTEQTVLVEMTQKQRSFYKTLKKNYIALTESGAQVSAWSDGGLHTKLAQATTGIEILDATAPPGGKLLALEKLLEDRGHLPLVIFTSFRATAHKVSQLAENMGRRCGLIMGGIPQDNRNLEIKLFQTGQTDTLIGTLETLSEGLTLTAADTCIFVEHSWRPSRNEQAMRRLHRIGQDRPVTVIHLITQDSVDERMQRVLAKKSDQVTSLMSALDFSQLL